METHPPRSRFRGWTQLGGAEEPTRDLAVEGSPVGRRALGGPRVPGWASSYRRRREARAAAEGTRWGGAAPAAGPGRGLGQRGRRQGFGPLWPAPTGALLPAHPYLSQYNKQRNKKNLLDGLRKPQYAPLAPSTLLVLNSRQFLQLYKEFRVTSKAYRPGDRLPHAYASAAASLHVSSTS